MYDKSITPPSMMTHASSRLSSLMKRGKRDNGLLLEEDTDGVGGDLLVFYALK